MGELPKTADVESWLNTYERICWIDNFLIYDVYDP